MIKFSYFLKYKNSVSVAEKPVFDGKEMTENINDTSKTTELHQMRNYYF